MITSKTLIYAIIGALFVAMGYFAIVGSPTITEEKQPKKQQSTPIKQDTNDTKVIDKLNEEINRLNSKTKEEKETKQEIIKPLIEKYVNGKKEGVEVVDKINKVSDTKDTNNISDIQTNDTKKVKDIDIKDVDMKFDEFKFEEFKFEPIEVK